MDRILESIGTRLPRRLFTEERYTGPVFLGMHIVYLQIEQDWQNRIHQAKRLGIVT
jgi:hypothetical protein